MQVWEQIELCGLASKSNIYQKFTCDTYVHRPLQPVIIKT